MQHKNNLIILRILNSLTRGILYNSQYECVNLLINLEIEFLMEKVR
jgi:hypothetical protein